MKFAKHSIFGRRVRGFHANFLGHGWRGVIVACQIPREWIANAILLVFVKLFNHLTSFTDLRLNTKLRLWVKILQKFRFYEWTLIDSKASNTDGQSKDFGTKIQMFESSS